MMKKILSLVIVLAMCLSLLPAAVLAEEEPDAVIAEADMAAEEPDAEQTSSADDAGPDEDGANQTDAEVEDLTAGDGVSDAGGREEEPAEEPLPEEPAVTEPDPDNRSEPEFVTEIYINPLYAEAYEAGAFSIRTPEPASIQTDGAADDVFTTVADAGAYVREQFKARNTTIIFTFSGYYSSLASEIWEEALKHTGIPDEGDYLRYQYGGYGMSASGYISAMTMTFAVTYYTDAAQESAVDAAVETALSSLNLSGKTAYERVRAVHDYVLKHVTYDETNLNNASYKLKYTAYAALINGTSVCQGYAVLTYRLMLAAGIDCRVITGGADNGSGYEDHAWNIVRLGGYYYYLDTTWDDGTSSEKYFLKCSFADHAVDTTDFPSSFFDEYPIASSDYSPSGSVHTEHTWNDGVVTTEPTCTEEGVITYTCTECFLEKSESIPVIDHTAAEAVKENNTGPTCTAAGSYDSVVYCSVCGAEMSRETVSVTALGHDYQAEVTAPTCTAQGYTTHTCSRCGNSYTDSYIDALGHSWGDWTVTAEAGEYTDGSRTRTCAVCGETETETIPALGHTHVLAETKAKAATCTEAGNTAYWTCTGCGLYFSDAAGTKQVEKESWIIPALGHDLEKVEAKAASTDSEGNIEYWTCSRCGSLFADAEGKAEISLEDTILPKIIPNDITGDGKTDNADIIALAKRIRDDAYVVNESAADENGDNTIDYDDLYALIDDMLGDLPSGAAILMEEEPYAAAMVLQQAVGIG